MEKRPLKDAPSGVAGPVLKMRMAPLAALLLSLLLIPSASPPSIKASEGEERLSIPIVMASAETGKKRLDGWKIKEWRGRAEYDVVETEIGDALHLKSNSTSTALYREVRFDARKYPVIRWKWKAVTLPSGADVRKRESDDQALQIYVIFKKWPSPVNTSLNTRTIGYVWDTSAPRGTVVTSSKTASTKYVVIRSGQGSVGEWIEEARNVYDDYRRLFREEPPPGAGVSIMIDSDDTKSTAESFIAEIYLAEK